MIDDAIDHALAYPFGIPEQSYLFDGDRPQPLPDPAAADVEGRTPVIALGSNQSPAQLARKFGGTGLGVIPVLKAWLAEFDVVYAAHLSRYGSVPATIAPSAGTEAAVCVTFLTAGQLCHMHETEIGTGNYDFHELSGVGLTLAGGAVLQRAWVYVARRGILSHQGAPLALAEVAASRRRHAAMRQPEVQALVRDRLAPDTDLRAFIAETVADETTRARRTEALAKDSHRFGATPETR